jgi:HEAT repeat protein
MGRWLWPLALVVSFAGGWAIAGFSRVAPDAVQEARQHDTVTHLQQQVDTLQARLRAREELAAARPTAAAATASRAAEPRATRDTGATVSRTAPVDLGHPTTPAERTATASRATGTAPAANVQAALDRFYRYLEVTNDSMSGRERWRQARELVDELRTMGPAAGQALMQILATGTDSDERRTAARLIGQLQIGAALPLLKDIIERDSDVLLRRAAAVGLRQLQTPESLPVMERMIANPGEDRFVRLSAAVGLAESGRPLGVAGLTSIFDEATADGRGRELAFRALVNLKDERPLAFMRQVATSPVEPGYRLQAIRYLSAQGDQQALATLHVLMTSPNEQPSIRDAAAQAYAAINATKR